MFKYIAPDLSNIAGRPLKMAADVKIQSFSDKTLRVMLDNIRFYSNGIEVSLTNAHQILEDQKSNRGGISHTAKSFRKYLTTPFMLNTKLGVVKNVIVSQNEPSEVTEIKKLLASDIENKGNHAQLEIVMKTAIISPLEVPKFPMKVDMN